MSIRNFLSEFSSGNVELWSDPLIFMSDQILTIIEWKFVSTLWRISEILQRRKTWIQLAWKGNFDEPHGPQSFWFSFGHVLECWYVVECIINIMMIILIYLVQDIVICSKYLVTQSVENLVNIMKILIPKMKLVSGKVNHYEI